MGKQKSLFDKFIQTLTHTKDVTPPNLQTYDIVMVGGTMASVLSTNVVHFTHGHKNVFYSSLSKEFQTYLTRPLYEQKRIGKMDYFISPGEMVESSVAKCGGTGFKRIMPEDNAVELNNGRVINYKTLAVATGLTPAPEKIEGFLEGLNDPDAPVYSVMTSLAPRKYFDFFPLFEHGNAFIYIPEFPFAGEVETYNFLMALSTWEMGERYGLVSPKHSLTIINANDRFASHCDVLDKFFRDKLAQYKKVNVLWNTKLMRIDSANNKLHVKQHGRSDELDFHRIYVHVPTKANPLLADSGLLKENPLLMPVNPKTLQHPDFPNISGGGEVLDLPILRCFVAGLNPAHVVRHNMLSQLENQRPNAEYKGQSIIPLYTGLNSASLYKSSYEGTPTISYNGFASRLYYSYLKSRYAKKLAKIYKGKAGGPPALRGYQKFPKGEQLSPAPVAEHH